MSTTKEAFIWNTFRRLTVPLFLVGVYIADDNRKFYNIAVKIHCVMVFFFSLVALSLGSLRLWNNFPCKIIFLFKTVDT